MTVSPKSPTPPEARPFSPVTHRLLQRKCSCGGTAGPDGECEECSRKKLQRKAAHGGSAPAHGAVVPPIVHEVLRSRGEPLDTRTRAFMEPRFGHDFSHVQLHAAPETTTAELSVNAPGDAHEQEAERIAGAVENSTQSAGSRVDFSQVRIHTGPKAAASALALGARAYTVGHQIVFGDGEYGPENRAGLSLLAHELAHVIQQDSGAVARKVQRAKIPYRQFAWTDFQGAVPAGSTFAAETSSGFTIPAWKPKVDVTDSTEACEVNKHKDTKRTAKVWVEPTVFDSIAALMDQGQSWVRPKFKDPDKECKRLTTECEAEIAKQTAAASKDCAQYVKPCQAAFDNGSTSYSIDSGGNKIEVTTKAECATTLVSGCEKLAAKTLLYEVKEDDTGTTVVSAASKADCSTQKFSGDCKKYYTDWSAKLLAHEQGHFDISNIIAKKAAPDLKTKAAKYSATGVGCGKVEANNAAVKAFDALNAPADLSQRGQDWIDLRTKAETDYDDQTNHGLKLPEQAAWVKDIAAGLPTYDLNKAAPPVQTPIQNPTQAPTHPGKARSATLRRAAKNGAAVNTAPPSVHEVLRSPGQPLDAATREFFEPRFGHDFSQVRVHTDGRAAQSAGEVNALAYAVGRQVVFGADEYHPGTEQGRDLLAHELAHTIQQTLEDGRASGPLKVTHPGDPSELAAHRAAHSALRQSVPGGVASHGLQPGGAFVLARRTPGLDGAPEADNTNPNPGPPPAPTAAPAAEAPAPLNAKADRLIAAFDSDPGSKRHWNLKELTKTILDALTASDQAYVRIFGVYPTKTGEDDPKEAAFERADTVRRALMQWIGPNKFSEDRFDVAFADGSIGDPQIQIYIAYKPTVVSDPSKGSPGGSSGGAPAPAPSPSPSGGDKTGGATDPNASSNQFGAQVGFGDVRHYYTTPAGPHDALHEWLVQAMLGYTRQIHGKNQSGPEVQGFGQVQYSLSTKQWTIGAGGQGSYVIALPADLQLSFWAQLMGGVNANNDAKQIGLSAGAQFQWQPADFFAIGAQIGVGPTFQSSGPNSIDRGGLIFIQIMK